MAFLVKKTIKQLEKWHENCPWVEQRTSSVIIELRFCSRGTKIPGNATLVRLSGEAPDSWRYIKSGGLKGLFREMFYGQIISTATCWLFPSVYTAALHRSMECQAQIHFTKFIVLMMTNGLVKSCSHISFPSFYICYLSRWQNRSVNTSPLVQQFLK